MRIIAILCIGLFLMQSGVSAAPKKDRAYYETRGDIVWEIRTDEKVLALTFDDGPHPTYTAQILELLKQYEAKATFFVVGNKIKLYPDVLSQTLSEGHEIANHTYSHAYLGQKNNIKKEINDTEALIYATTGRRSQLFRPPGGFYNERLVQIVRDEGYKMIMWSWQLDTKDWDTPGVNKIVNRVLNNANNGNIVLFHDYIEGPTQTIAALKIILPELKSRGYRMITVSELLGYNKAIPAKIN
ncbi:polysaccharide deacetylase family sporulation protein PdaB [Paenibacillus marchantiophytorum]|uniref:Polysaccharide deacetylase family sporulation protein PdaB n=1 Tax=Paenibacillus marchantiophytorum TaxID=1619310 RepID=A0ABQ1FAK9_9BACL|nr:polysaccharide deacetylase family protein [Paenibacillus marchantiophytorum]GGA03604.1 polysaccharide deacetylase family sporulation protein PdaB [Paenibacillus marchantiophytorum]